MMATSKIEWTERTWNPVVGCKEVSPGCANCYAATMAHRLSAMAAADIKAGRNPGRKRHYIGTTAKRGGKTVWTGKVNLAPDALAAPLSWKKPQLVFVNSMSDLFHEDVPFEFIDKVFAVMNATAVTLPATPQSGRWHTYQVLTKRPDRMADYMLSRATANWPKIGSHPWFNAGRGDGGVLRGHGSDLMNAGAIVQFPPPNVMLGTSVENQKEAEQRLPHLLRCPAAIRFVSAEPLLEAVDIVPVLIAEKLRHYEGKNPHEVARQMANREMTPAWLDWIIVGGESGPGARPCNVEWIRSIVAQCKSAGVACFVKQLGAKPVAQRQIVLEEGESLDDLLAVQTADKKGGDISEWPEDLRFRELPVPSSTNQPVN